MYFQATTLLTVNTLHNPNNFPTSVALILMFILTTIPLFSSLLNEPNLHSKNQIYTLVFFSLSLKV